MEEPQHDPMAKEPKKGGALAPHTQDENLGASCILTFEHPTKTEGEAKTRDKFQSVMERAKFTCQL